MVVHSVLPDALAVAVGEVLGAAGVEHVAHPAQEPMRAARAAAADPHAAALIGPYRSADVAEAVEATAPEGLPLLAPVATWAGVTRDDEPGCDEAARHAGTVLRIPARDTVVAARVVADLAGSGSRAHVIAGDHDYGRQLAGQLRMAGLDDAPERDADVVVLCGLAGHEETERAAALAPLPVIAFDGIQGADLGAGRHVLVALPHAPVEGCAHRDVFAGVPAARRAAQLAAAAAAEPDRAGALAALRRLGGFDDHGDPLDPPVWLWRSGPGWELAPERPL